MQSIPEEHYRQKALELINYFNARLLNSLEYFSKEKDRLIASVDTDSDGEYGKQINQFINKVISRLKQALIFDCANRFSDNVIGNIIEIGVAHSINDINKFSTFYLNSMSLHLSNIVDNLKKTHNLLEKIGEEVSKEPYVMEGYVHRLKEDLAWWKSEYARIFKQNNITTVTEFEIKTDRGFLFLDVESVGLNGEAFAFAYIITNSMGIVMLENFVYTYPDGAIGSEEDRLWIKENCSKHFVDNAGDPHVSFGHRVNHPADVRHSMKLLWDAYSDTHTIVTDCAYPVETNFLASCKLVPQPYPIIDISSLLFIIDKDPIGSYERLENELPYHHPLADIRQTMRLFFHIRNGKYDEIKYKND